MHDTRLHVGQRPGGPDRLGEALQPVAAHDEGVGDAAVAQLGEHRHPELGALPAGGSDPHPQHVAFAVQVDAHRHVDGPVGDLAVADLHHDGVDQDHRIDPVQRPVLPGDQVLDDRVGDPARSCPGRSPCRRCRTGEPGCRRWSSPWRRARSRCPTGPSSRRCPFGTVTGSKLALRSRGTRRSTLADVGRHRLRVGAVAAVARPAALHGVGLVAEMIGELHLQTGLQHLTDQRREQPVLTGQLHPLGAGPSDQLVSPVPHGRLITHQRDDTRPVAPARRGVVVVVVIGVILSGPRRSAADPQITSGYTTRRTVPRLRLASIPSARAWLPTVGSRRSRDSGPPCSRNILMSPTFGPLVVAAGPVGP